MSTKKKIKLDKLNIRRYTEV